MVHCATVAAIVFRVLGFEYEQNFLAGAFYFFKLFRREVGVLQSPKKKKNNSNPLEFSLICV